MALSAPVRPNPLRRAVAVGVLAGLLLVPTGILPAGGQAADPEERAEIVVAEDWVWPLHPFRVVRPFAAPAHEYGPGHRGIDLAAGSGDTGEARVRAPAGGAVAFVGQVAGRPVLTIDHGAGLVTTFEPVETVLTPGSIVARGDEVGRLGTGGHAATGELHFGVRLHGDYINPLLLLGGVPRAVLLPCC
jgi:murein DD-endopeptidase MepM/ murein hydrolase activator NlpD